MKTYFSALFFILSINHSYSQIVFKKDYIAALSTNADLFELSNGKFIVPLDGFTIIDSIGSILLDRAFIYPQISGGIGYGKISDNNYIFHGEILDSCSAQPSNSPFNAILDSNGNIINISAYTLQGNCYASPVAMGVTKEKGLISLGVSRPQNYYALCTDSNLNIKWAKYYTNHIGSPVLKGWGQFGTSFSDSGFLLGFNLDSIGPVVARTDSLGNNIWCKSYFRPKGQLHDCVVLSDGSTLVTGYTDTTRISFMPKLFLMKLDTSGQVLWCKGYDNLYNWKPSGSSIIVTSDGNYMILANDGSNKELLIKIDNNGDTIWTRRHGIPDYNNVGYSITETSNGSYIFAGKVYGSFPGNYSSAAFIYKTDSLGNSSCNLNNIPLYVYDLFPSDSNVFLTSIDGATRKSAFINDTVITRTVYDECSILNYVSTLNRGIKNYSLLPNPTTGIIRIYRTDPFSSNCYYTVYDGMGRIVILQRKFEYGKKETPVDFSNFGKGIYLLKITDGANVCTEKVIVE